MAVLRRLEVLRSSHDSHIFVLGSFWYRLWVCFNLPSFWLTYMLVFQDYNCKTSSSSTSWLCTYLAALSLDVSTIWTMDYNRWRTHVQHVSPGQQGDDGQIVWLRLREVRMGWIVQYVDWRMLAWKKVHAKRVLLWTTTNDINGISKSFPLIWKYKQLTISFASAASNHEHNNEQRRSCQK